MNKDFITIQDAAAITNKSVQTIRRAIKSKKLKVKKERTPQGFNYLVNRDALFKLYKVKAAAAENTTTNQTTSQPTKQKGKQKGEMSLYIKTEEMVEFHKTLQQITHDHAQERQNYLRLVQALQEKIVALENQFKLLQEAGSKRWFQFWK